MGAKQRGQARTKKAAKGSMKGQPMSQKKITQSILIPDLSPTVRAKSLQNWGAFAASSSSQVGHGFSMSEEARNTDRRGFGWGTVPLRTQAITFVSAGPLKREEDAWNTVSEDDSPQKQSDADLSKEAADAVQEVVEDVLGAEPDRSIPEESENVVQQAGETSEAARAPSSNADGPAESGIIDQLVSLEEKAPADNEASPTPSEDSDEEIIFSGRSGPQLPSRKPTPAPRPQVLAEPDKLPEMPSARPIAKAAFVHQFATSTTIGLDSPLETVVNPANSKLLKEKARGRSPKDTPRSRKHFGRKYDEDELMQDYIDNMALDDSDEEDEKEDDVGGLPYRKAFKKTEHFRLFNGDGLENEKVQTTSNGRKSVFRDVPNQAIDWDSDDLADFDELSTTDEEVEDVDQVIRHRTRVTGAQYLVIGSGGQASDAKWILHEKLISQSAVSEIKIYEEIRRMNIEEADLDEDDDDEDDSDEGSDEEALQDLMDNIESENDENARILKYTSRMTDEQIARALAKQEELGLGGDELMIFDGDVANGTETPDDAFGFGEDFIPFSLSKHTSNRGRSKRNKKQRDSFPSAEAFADALDQDPYGAFDIMDFDRPSLRPKKKGRKSDYPFDLEGLEDEDLRDQLVNTWTKDREKKAERKRLREEARLTANLDAADAGDPDVIKARVRQFLVQDVDVLKLSPMEAPIRAAVHRLAKSLKLHSKSEGKEGFGFGRYPVLTKTPRTPQYTFETIWQVDDLMNLRKFFPKHLYKMSKGPRSSGAPRQRRGGGGMMSGATYRDGEEVAGSAPEIGADNRGRAMLEKMGWVAGTGIGAIGNQGGLDPIRHIVKTTKAGLG